MAGFFSDSLVGYSPLAGCSDFPFRKMVRRYFKGLIFCEMVKMQALLRCNEETLSYLDFSPDMHPIGGQIVGGDPSLAGASAKIIEDRGFDVVDLNCGCPVDKITKDGSGSGMLKDPQKIGEALSNMKAAVKIPVTVKIRIGWDTSSINACEIVRIAEEAGASVISIHGRTRVQSYKGLADRDAIGEAVKAARTIKVAGNGDIFDAESALHMLEHTGCDYVLASRGTMGKPWIGDDIERALNNLPPITRTTEDYLDTLLDHIGEIERYRPARKQPFDIRRVACWYCKAAPGISALRAKLSRVPDTQTARDLIHDYRSQLRDSQQICL